MQLHSIYIQFASIFSGYFFKLQLMLKIILHLITCRIIWMLRIMKKRNSDKPVKFHNDHLADLIEVLKDNVAQCRPK